MNRELYPCPYQKECPLGIGTDTCFCKLQYEYWAEKDKINALCP